MTEWIVPLTGILVYLFFCPGCFLWIWLYNRKVNTRQRELRAAEGAVLTPSPDFVTARGDEMQRLAEGAA